MLDAIYRAVGVPQMHVVRSRDGAQTAPIVSETSGYHPHMTGLGIAWAVQAVKGDRLDGLRVCIQGFGAVGSGGCSSVIGLGARIVGVSDASGAYLNDQGLIWSGCCPPPVWGVLALDGCTPVQREQLFDVEADMVVLSASSHSVDESIATDYERLWS